MLPHRQTQLLQYIHFMIAEVTLCYMDIITKVMTIVKMMAFKCCLLAAQMSSFTSTQPVFHCFQRKKKKSASSRLVLTQKDYGKILHSPCKNQYPLRLPVPTVFLEEKGNQRLPTFGVVFELSEVPSV